MKTRLLLSLILLFVFVLPLSAQDDDNPDIPQTYILPIKANNTSYEITINYPNEWFVNEIFNPYILRLFNNLEIIEDPTGSIFNTGDILVLIQPIPLDSLGTQNIRLSNNVAEMVMDYGQQFRPEFTADIQQIGDYEVAVGDLVLLGGEFGIRFFGLLFDELFIMIHLNTSLDELDQNSDIMNAIVGSIDVATQPIAVIDADEDTDDTAIVLSETITIDDTEGGALSINYPAEWFTEASTSDGSLVISNSETGLGLDLSDGSLVESGEIALGILPIPEELMELLIEPDTELTVESALEGFSALLLEDPSLGIDVGEITLRDIGFIETAYVTGNLMVDNEPLQDVKFMTLLANGGYVLLVIVADSNEMDDWQGMIDDMIRSIEYTAP